MLEKLKALVRSQLKALFIHRINDSWLRPRGEDGRFRKTSIAVRYVLEDEVSGRSALILGDLDDYIARHPDKWWTKETRQEKPMRYSDLALADDPKESPVKMTKKEEAAMQVWLATELPRIIASRPKPKKKRVRVRARAA